MCHFVTQRFVSGAIVCSEHDGARLREGEADSPVRNPAAGQTTEFVVVTDEDKPDGIKIDPAQPRPLDLPVGDLCQGNRQIGIARPTDDGDITDLGCRRRRRLLQGG